MDEHTLRVLEFDKILRMAGVFAVTAPGRAVIGKMKPLKNIGEIRLQIDLVSECRSLLSKGESLGIEHFDDLAPLFHRIRPADAVLEPFELRSFLPLFSSALSLHRLSHDPLSPRTGKIVSQLITHPDLKRSIDTSIDREGKIRDGASPELSHIRKSIRSVEKKIKSTLEEILKQKDLEPHLQDFFIAERNNRLVIPVKIDSKGSVPGIVHDISNTGETVYVEPYSIQHLGNELESLRAEEKLEEYRILKMLSSLLREHLPEIESDYHIIARVDAINALAKFAEHMAMSPPEINEGHFIKIINGRHPLLWKTLRKENREDDLVPLNMTIGKEHSCMVITGSNAGGKTVALKTTGVLTLMALSGMHTPAESGTTFPFIVEVLADIGDEQSIEQNLSTFSAHIKRISEIIRRSRADALIIIDELGTGTDPEQGGALSCAILRRLKQQGALVVVSTHLGMLKAFAHSEPGLINSAMEMEEIIINNAPAYRPTYKLVIGEPGTSHAFEIAESLGLSEDIIRDARSFTKGEGVHIESLISELKQKNQELEKSLREIEQTKKEVELLRSELKEKLSGIASLKEKALVEAMDEAEEILSKTKREAREIIRTLRKSRPSEAGKIIKDIDKRHDEIKRVRQLHFPEKTRKLKEVVAGQRVFINSLRTHGTVSAVNAKARKCTVLVNGKEIMIPVSGLSEPVKDFQTEEKTVFPECGRVSASPDILENTELSGELNVVGQRVDPALSVIERHLNDAALKGLRQIKIIHGIGSGILSRAIREYLKDHPLVEMSRKGNEDEGGEAVTVVFL